MLSSVFHEGVTKLLPGIDAAEEVADPCSSCFQEYACSETGTCPRLALENHGLSFRDFVQPFREPAQINVGCTPDVPLIPLAVPANVHDHRLFPRHDERIELPARQQIHPWQGKSFLIPRFDTARK